ncbi:hypothetical protein Ndes2437B_g02505 [Nannochloris sp. 'desiccata']
MAAMHEEEVIETSECANCGATEDLLKCSRCHTTWFCGVKCQKAYWPFHKSECRCNEFADIIEESEPKFARWMRSHGKLAVLKDDEVDRLERASSAASGPSRQDVMDSMYGRLEPKPKEASYSAEERLAMHRKIEEEKTTARRAALLPPSYLAIDIPRDMGMDCGTYRWKQTQSHVEIFLPLPENITVSKISVSIKPSHLTVDFDERPMLKGKLYREIKADESTWYIQDKVLEIVLLKRNRKGNYQDGMTNADTFWKSVLKSAPETEVLALEHPPTSYYWAPCEDAGSSEKEVRRLQPSKGQKRGDGAVTPAALAEA